MSGGSAITSSPIETRTIRKLRIRIIPFLFLLYIVAYLDRINIGFAALTMNKELAITSRQFGLLVGIFFFGYFLFEIPSNILLHKIGARIWIARILITWGIVAMLTGAVHSLPQLYVASFLLDRAHWAEISSWRWLLILEGLPAIVGGILTYFLLPSRPADAAFLTGD